MTRNVAKLALIALWALSPLAGVGIASADPANCAGLYDQRLCDLSKTYFCPGQGTYLPALTPCPAYVIGPHHAGMPPDDVTPNEGPPE